jgi:hypothetical protein
MIPYNSRLVQISRASVPFAHGHLRMTSSQNERTLRYGLGTLGVDADGAQVERAHARGEVRQGPLSVRDRGRKIPVPLKPGFPELLAQFGTDEMCNFGFLLQINEHAILHHPVSIRHPMVMAQVL